MNDIMVSVICAAYNHEKYIRNCLDGFVMQQGVTFEVLINDDASTDHTAAIIKEYEQKYPDIIKPTYQTENQYSKNVSITRDILFSQATGKYIAFCEGDDYWCDPFKLKKQVDIMEQHPECHFCVHTVACINEDGTANAGRYPSMDIPSGFISEAEYFKLIEDCSFQTSCYFFRFEDYWNYTHPVPEFVEISSVGDICMMLFFGAHLRNAYYIKEIMSHYRMNAIGSWNQRQAEGGIAKKIELYHTIINVLDSFDRYTNGKFAKYINHWKLNKQYRIECLTSNYKNMLRAEYRNFLKIESYKFKICALIGAYCPSILKLLKKHGV